MSSVQQLTRRVIREGRVVSVRAIGFAAVPSAPAPQSAAARPSGFAPRYSDELVAAAKALYQVGIPSSRIAELLKIPDSHEALKWWTRGLSRKRVPMSRELYETIMAAIERSLVRQPQE